MVSVCTYTRVSTTCLPIFKCVIATYSIFLIRLLLPFFFFFFLNDPAPTEISPFPLPAALPIKGAPRALEPLRKLLVELAEDRRDVDPRLLEHRAVFENARAAAAAAFARPFVFAKAAAVERSEEHTSELQSQSNLVCRLLLEKKN